MEDSQILIPVLSILTLIFISAFFSGSETGLTSISRAKIHKLQMDGNRRAGAVSKLHKDKEKLISAILLGNNVVNIAASSIATALAITLFGQAGVIYATLAMTILVLIFAEVLPKTYAVRHSEQVALTVAPLLTIITKLLSPFTVTVQVIVNKTLSFISVAPKDQMSGVDAVRGAVDLYHQEGNFLTEDKDMLSGIFDLGDTEVEQVMVHRSDMVAVSIDLPIDELVAFVADCLHSRIPVWENTPDNIIGILHTKDILKALQNLSGNLKTEDIRAVLREARFVPESINLKNQLKAFQKNKHHIALVVDEFGSVTGLITLEDIIEEVVGEIDDEHDLPSPKRIRRCKDGSYNVDGDLALREANRELNLNLLEEDANTLAGYLILHAQAIPEVDEIFEIDDLIFRVTKREGNQITEIKIRKLSDEKPVELPDPEKT